MFFYDSTGQKNFNSQPHKEADHIGVYLAVAKGISTHSLTRRLTAASCKESPKKSISTHSLTRRLTV